MSKYLTTYHMCVCARHVIELKNVHVYFYVFSDNATDPSKRGTDVVMEEKVKKVRSRIPRLFGMKGH